MNQSFFLPRLLLQILQLVINWWNTTKTNHVAQFRRSENLPLLQFASYSKISLLIAVNSVAERQIKWAIIIWTIIYNLYCLESYTFSRSDEKLENNSFPNTTRKNWFWNNCPQSLKSINSKIGANSELGILRKNLGDYHLEPLIALTLVKTAQRKISWYFKNFVDKLISKPPPPPPRISIRTKWYFLYYQARQRAPLRRNLTLSLWIMSISN